MGVSRLKDLDCQIGDIIANISLGEESGVYEVTDVEDIYKAKYKGLALYPYMYFSEETREMLHEFNFETDFFKTKIITTQRKHDQASVSFFENSPEPVWAFIVKNNVVLKKFSDLNTNEKERLLNAYKNNSPILMGSEGNRWSKMRPYTYDKNAGEFDIFCPDNVYVFLKHSN